MNAALAALFGAAMGGVLSVFASWLAQRIQSKSQLLSQDIQLRQQLYSEFVAASARSYADALEQDEADPGMLANLYGEIGRMRLYSSDAVVTEANRIMHRILDTYGDINRTRVEIRDFLARDSIDLFSAFSEACRTELTRLRPGSTAGLSGLMRRIAPNAAQRHPRRALSDRDGVHV
jgi:hypothetical protein